MPSSSVKFRYRAWRRWLFAASVILLFAAAVGCRALMLDRLPGLNGDEAWLGVQVQHWLRGEVIAWQTPTGNPVNPLMFLPMAALHAWLPPSITLLRLTALLSGLLALGVNYILCRRVLGPRQAAFSTLVLTVLPATIAYSRFAWDASQTVLVSLPVLYCSMGAVRSAARGGRWLASAAAALLLAVLVHPTNVFLAPLVIVAAAWCGRQPLRAFASRWKSERVFWPALIVLLVVAGASIFLVTQGDKPGLQTHAAQGAERIVSPVQAAVFAQRCVDLLSGTSVYRFIPASQLQTVDPETLAYRAMAWAILLMAAYGAWMELRQQRRPDAAVLMLGLGLSLAAFYLVAGPGALQPHFERYGMWMIAPCSLVLATGLGWWTKPRRKALRLRPAMAMLLAWAMLAGFGWHYFRPLLSGRTDAHVAFRTAHVEPKLAALRLIEAQQSGQPARIAAEGWWLYWPLAYLAGEHPRCKVFPRDVPTIQSAETAGAWKVTFCEPAQAAAATPVTLGASPQIIMDAAGRPLVRIVPPAAVVGKNRPDSLP